MRRPWKIIGWVFAFGAAFTIGAVIAAHSDPFPPGVSDPGARPTPSESASVPEHLLVGTLKLVTTHALYVGGACHTNWAGTLMLTQDPSGSIAGGGAVNLLGRLHCDFSVIQAQTKTINVRVQGSVKGARVTVQLIATGNDPKASSDFGGFAHTLRFLGLSVPLDGTQQVHASRSDGDRGTYTATGTFAVTCSSGCS